MIYINQNLSGFNSIGLIIWTENISEKSNMHERLRF